MNRSILKILLVAAFMILFMGTALPALASSLGEYTAISRYDYYTNEESVEIAVWIPASKTDLSLSIDIVFEYEHLLKGASVLPGQLSIYEFPSKGFKMGSNELTVSYFENGKWVDSDKVQLVVLEDKYNAVKIDRVSGGLIVNGLPFFPFGFYNYSPVQPWLAEEEVVKGFNMMSPYQKIEGKTLKERKAYMDRCAAVGMKVNYNLLSLAAGGGVASAKYDKLSPDKRIKMLRKEIETFKDHPALLSWYISDEPVGQGVPPDSLEFAYKLIKEMDPYHPVTVVFMSPWMAKDYSHVMDIVMADPYPIPDGKVDEVGAAAAMLHNTFFLDKPVWIVPQAFGGNEWWLREPTKQEMRVMTYLAVVNNAMGIQYFIRNGLNAFPKSTVAWNECAAISLEIAELTPYLFSADPVYKVNCDNINIQLKARAKDGSIVVMAVNTSNNPLEYSFSLEGFEYSGTADLMFEDRKVVVEKGRIADIIDAYGTRVYQIRYKMGMSKGAKSNPKNILKDPSFENITGLGIPASCYAKAGDDRGATYFIDARTAAQAQHSLRLTTPANDEGMTLSFYRLRIEPNQSYTMSVQAKALPLKFNEKIKKGFFKKLCGCGPDEDDYPSFSMSFGENCKEYFVPGGEWQEYSFSCIPEIKPESPELSPVLKLDTKGTAWFDLLQVYPDMGIKSFVNRENNHVSVMLSCVHKGAKIHYTLDGSDPTEESETAKVNIIVSKSSTLRAAAYIDGKRVGYFERYLEVSKATGRYVEYRHKYSDKYNAGLKNGLVDGILASPDFKDEKWQGFEGTDFDVTLYLSEVQKVKEVTLRFLSNASAWIFLPEDIKILWSANGNDYYEFQAIVDQSSIQNDDPRIVNYIFRNDGVDARYIRIIAKNIGTCPDGHPGAGGKAWLFTDEIIVR